MIRNPCDVHINFAFQFMPPLFLPGPLSGPKPGLPCKTAAMQNGAVGVMGDCIHTSVIQISPIQALTLHSISFPCRPIRLDISGHQSGAGRNRNIRFRGPACGYGSMRGQCIEGRERGYVLYSGPTQANCSGCEFTCIKIQVSQGISLGLTGGNSRSYPYAAPYFQCTNILWPSTHL